MADQDSAFKLTRRVAAIAVALLFLAMFLPSTGSVQSNNFPQWPFWTVAINPIGFIMLWTLTLGPLVCILYGIRRNRFLESVGWIMWVALMVYVAIKQ